ncbi:hypothetical protein IL54_0948 [Sphingobium sp. ba1]|nr:hypothetical protein IL54_0948 [Sphingobium sp. ba1]
MATGAVGQFLIARIEAAGFEIDQLQKAEQDSPVPVLQAVRFPVALCALVVEQLIERLQYGTDPVPSIADGLEHLSALIIDVIAVAAGRAFPIRIFPIGEARSDVAKGKHAHARAPQSNRAAEKRRFVWP